MHLEVMVRPVLLPFQKAPDAQIHRLLEQQLEGRG
jgi:hypothetical protein